MSKNVVVLTGAGISAESGVSTFRDNNGLWCSHRIEEVATPEAFEHNPALVQQFYNQRRAQLSTVHPNAAHVALAEFGRCWQGDFLLVTQNVDDLHDRAGANYQLIHMHGELSKVRCVETDMVFDWVGDVMPESQCACCHEMGTLRPHIVWFGEMPLEMPKIYQALTKCDVFLSIGTSGNVYPAAGFVQEVRANGRGARTVELNLEPSQGHSLFEERIYGKATEIVPAFLEKLRA